jgi:hypothetical protein
MDCTVSLMLPGPRAGHPDHFTAPLSTFSFDRTVPPWRSFHGEPLSPPNPPNRVPLMSASFYTRYPTTPLLAHRQSAESCRYSRQREQAPLFRLLGHQPGNNRPVGCGRPKPSARVARWHNTLSLFPLQINLNNSNRVQTF